MAYDFLGSFKKRDLENFETFARSELDKSPAIINRLIFERHRLRKMLNDMVRIAHEYGVDPIVWGREFNNVSSFPWFDRGAGLYVQRIKEPMYQSIKLKERIEHQILKLVDRMEQLEEHIARIKFTNAEFASDMGTLKSMINDQNPFIQAKG